MQKVVGLVIAVLSGWLYLHYCGNEEGLSGEPPTTVNGASEKLQVKGFVRISAGSFTMGAPKDEHGWYVDERQHTVTLTRDFYLGKHEVTQREFAEVVRPYQSVVMGDDLPVNGVSWFDAIEYTNALSLRENLPICYEPNGRVVGGGSVYDCEGYRLPTEAEWEFAARGNTLGARYGELDEVAWYVKNSGKKPKPVGLKVPNAYGLYDMLGNVWEWCHDWYGLYPRGMQVDPEGLRKGVRRVRRGGCSGCFGKYTRAGDRNRRRPRMSSAERRKNGAKYGFRVARTAP